MFIIPDDFLRKASAFHNDEEGQAWLDRLPTILADCEQRWQLRLAAPFVYQTYAHHYVAPAVTSDGQAVVVKAHAPTREFPQEAEALRLYEGRGIVRLLDVNRENKVLLLERLQPGTPLSRLEDDVEATSQAANIMRQLWCHVPDDHPFPLVRDWGQGLQRLRQHYAGGHGPFPALLLAEAESLFAELDTSMTEQVLLHGDLHHDNILAAEREPWLAIDPKGLVGELAYETGALIRNRLPDMRDAPQAIGILARRIDQLAEELDLDRVRVRDWAVAQAVLSAWWIIEDGVDGWKDLLACAQLLAAIKR